MSDTSDLEQLELFLRDQLDNYSRERLTRELKDNPELRTNLEILKLSIESAEAKGWKQLIRSTQQEYLSRRNNRPQVPVSDSGNGKKTWFWISRIAASFAMILVGTCSVFFLTTNENNVNSSFDLKYKDLVLRSGQNNTSSLKEAYQHEDYELVLKLGEKSSIDDIKSYFLIAISFIETGQPEQAEKLLLEIEDKNTELKQPYFTDEIDYYLIKVYLSQGKPTEAGQRLQKILNDPAHTYHRNISMLDLWKIKILEIKK